MKKIFLFLIAIFVIGIAAIYILIPSTLKVSHYGFYSLPNKSLVRGLNNFSNWNQWWPENSNVGSDSGRPVFKVSDITYEPYKQFDNGSSVLINLHEEKIISLLRVLSFTGDSTAIEWSTEIPAGINPIERIKKYLQANAIKKNMDSVLDNFKVFTQDNKNIYGFHIERKTFMDTVFLIENLELNHYPSPAEVYTHLNALRQYCTSQGAIIKDYSMQNVRKMDSAEYNTTVAVCINKTIPDKGSFKINHMPVNHNGTLYTRVMGPTSKVEEAHQALRNYMRDYLIQIKAMSFDMLMNDRSKMKDSTQWETIVNYPCTPN